MPYGAPEDTTTSDMELNIPGQYRCAQENNIQNINDARGP